MIRASLNAGRLIARACGFLLLLAALIACVLGGGGEPDNSSNKRRDGSNSSSGNGANEELCRKYDSCGCLSYDKCMEQFESDPNIEKPGVRECLTNSSCQSLCAGKPDGCAGAGQAGEGTGTGTGSRSNCAAISCSKNSDCPADCYGGCDGVRCYSF